MTTLADLTTLRIGGPVATLVEAASEDELVETVRAADAGGTPLLVLGGGSNVVASDERFDGVVVRDTRRGVIPAEVGGCAGATFVVPAGQPWDEVVERAIEEEWSGLEALSGIPGSTGATPVQNVGAYGQEVSGVLSSVRAYDRLTGSVRTFALHELRLGYRSSLLKDTLHDAGAGGGRVWGPTGRYVVLDVTFQTRLASLSAPVRYAELARTLGVEVGARVPAGEVRAAVLQLRRGKGMVLDDADPDTWSVGSFFTNPILAREEADRLPAVAPRFDVADYSAVAQIGAPAPVLDGVVKTSAAWLISRAGFPAGYAMPGPAALSTKHCLAVTNRGGATSDDVLALAREVRDGVRETFGVTLVPEPVLLGLTL